MVALRKCLTILEDHQHTWRSTVLVLCEEVQVLAAVWSPTMKHHHRSLHDATVPTVTQLEAP